MRNSLPDLYGGIQNSLSYKGVQLDVLFQFVKQKGPNALFFNSIGPFPGGINLFTGAGNQPISVLSRWQKPGDITPIERYSTNMVTGNAVVSDAAYSDASFIRLKNLSISYQMLGQWRKKIRYKIVGIFLHGTEPSYNNKVSRIRP